MIGRLCAAGRLTGGLGSRHPLRQDLRTEASEGEAEPGPSTAASTRQGRWGPREARPSLPASVLLKSGPRATVLGAWAPVCFILFEANPLVRRPAIPLLPSAPGLTCSMGPPAFGGSASRALSILLPRPHSAGPASGKTWGQQGRSGQPTRNPSRSPSGGHGQGTSRNSQFPPPGPGIRPLETGHEPDPQPTWTAWY